MVEYEYALCSADTPLATGSWTDVTGATLSLGAGTWLVMATVMLQNAGATSTCGLKLYYDSTDMIAVESSMTAGFNRGVSLHAIVVLAGAEDVKLAGRMQAATSFNALEFGDPNTGAASIPGTNIMALKLAA